VCSRGNAEARGQGDAQFQTGTDSSNFRRTWRYATQQHENGRVAAAGLRLIVQNMRTEDAESNDRTLGVSKIIILVAYYYGLAYGGALPLCSALQIKGLERCNPCRCYRDKLPRLFRCMMYHTRLLAQQNPLLISQYKPISPTAAKVRNFESVFFSLRLLWNSPVIATIEMNVTQICQTPWNPSFRWKQHSESLCTHSQSIRAISYVNQAASPLQKDANPILESYNKFQTAVTSTRK
jgi:hypothetical protein